MVSVSPDYWGGNVSSIALFENICNNQCFDFVLRFFNGAVDYLIEPICTYDLSRGYVKPKSSLVKFAVRLRGKNVEVRIATPMKNVGKGEEGADGLTNIK